MRVRFGDDNYEMDSPDLGRLRDSGGLAGDIDALKKRLDEDGYLYLKGFLDREAVLAARRRILGFMNEREGLEPGSRPLDGVMGQYGQSVNMMGRRPITHEPEVRAVLESPRLFDLYERIHNEPVTTFAYKWLRAVGNEDCTGSHMDYVYMGRGSTRLMTAWVPFGDIPIEQGTLAVCARSHVDPAFEKLRNTYGKMDVDRDGIAGWFTRSPREITDKFGGRWLTDDVESGDVITFGMHTMHASTTNTTDRWRVSCDVRFQPVSDPVDDRWAGEKPKAHTPPADPVPMEVARAEWGV